MMASLYQLPALKGAVVETWMRVSPRRAAAVTAASAVSDRLAGFLPEILQRREEGREGGRELLEGLAGGCCSVQYSAQANPPCKAMTAAGVHARAPPIAGSCGGTYPTKPPPNAHAVASP